MNLLGKARVPFFFLIDYAFSSAFIYTNEELRGSRIRHSLDSSGRESHGMLPAGRRNFAPPRSDLVESVSQERYNRAFDLIQSSQFRGESLLANLTFPSRLLSPVNMEMLYQKSDAAYRVFIPDQLVVFSPESFVDIEEDGRISTRPMKGTLLVSGESGGDSLLHDEKEKAEHATVVDLLRNDLSRVASRVRVTRYRYLEAIPRGDKILYQTSSLIQGEMGERWHGKAGDVIASLLPAGSVTGAPKKRTCEIIAEAEGYDRGYYTGVFGYYNGESLKSAVMIRMIEKRGDDFFYFSGGGITIYSSREKEYQELLDKIYVPVC